MIEIISPNFGTLQITGENEQNYRIRVLYDPFPGYLSISAYRR